MFEDSIEYILMILSDLGTLNVVHLKRKAALGSCGCCRAVEPRLNYTVRDFPSEVYDSELSTSQRLRIVFSNSLNMADAQEKIAVHSLAGKPKPLH